MSGVKTLTVTAARAKLGYWLRRAANGENIGIVCGARLFPLRPAPIEAGDYAEQEYGMTAAEVDDAASRITAEGQQALAAGDFVTAEQFLHALESRSGKRRSAGRRKAAGR
jgi:hypothetical protein